MDVCVDYVGRDGVPDMNTIVRRSPRMSPLPLMIDSTQLDVIEAGLKHAPGKCIVNSINLEDGEAKLAAMCYLLKRYGAGVVAGTIDEDKIEAMGKTADRKLAIARRLYDLCSSTNTASPKRTFILIHSFSPWSPARKKCAAWPLKPSTALLASARNSPTATRRWASPTFRLDSSRTRASSSTPHFSASASKPASPAAIVHASKILPQVKDQSGALAMGAGSHLRPHEKSRRRRIQPAWPALNAGRRTQSGRGRNGITPAGRKAQTPHHRWRQAEAS